MTRFFQEIWESIKRNLQFWCQVRKLHVFVLRSFLFSILAVKRKYKPLTLKLIQHMVFLVLGWNGERILFLFVIVYNWSRYNKYIVDMVCHWIGRRIYICIYQYSLFSWSNVFLGDVPTSRWSIKREVKKRSPWFYCDLAIDMYHTLCCYISSFTTTSLT